MKAKKKYYTGGKVTEDEKKKNLAEAAAAAKKQRGKYSKERKPIDRIGDPSGRIKPINKMNEGAKQRAPEVPITLSQDDMARLSNIMRKITANPQKATDQYGFPTYRQKKF